MRDKIKPNRQLIRQDFLGYWPIWAGSLLAFGMFGLLPMIFNMQSILHGDYIREMAYSMNPVSSAVSPAESKRMLGNLIMEAAEVLSNSFLLAGLAFLVALCVFGYLFRRRQAYMVHAFPMSRGSLFASHYLAGLGILFTPYVVLWAALAVTGAAFDVSCGSMIATGMYVSALTVLFFYHLSVLVMMLVGNLFYAVSVYLGLNLLYGIWDYLMSNVQTMFCYGFSQGSLVFSASSRWDQILVPPVYFLAHNPLEHMGTRAEYWTCMRGCSLFWIPSVLFLGLAFLCYRKRAVECAGDGMAFSWGVRIYRIVFTLTGGLVCSMPLFLIQSLVNDPSEINYRKSGMIMAYAGLAAGLVIAYFIAEMLLYKRFFIWKKTSYVRLLVLVLAGLGLFAGRNFKYGQGGIPTASQISMLKVTLPYINSNLYIDPHDYTDWLDLQKDLYRERASYIREKRIDDNTGYDSFYVTVERKNGKKKNWMYSIPDNSSVMKKLSAMAQQQEGLERRLFAGDLNGKTVRKLEVNKYSQMDDEMIQTATPVHRNKQEVIRAIHQDMEEGNLTLEQFGDMEISDAHYEIEMDVENENSGKDDFHRTICVDEKCRNLMKVLDTK